VAFTSSNSRAAAACRPNAWITVMPLTCSLVVAFIRAVVLRIERNASRMRRRTNITSSATGGTPTNATSERRTSSDSISTMMPISLIRSPRDSSAPEANSSSIASTSLVTRDTSLPTSWRSKNPSRWRCKKRNT
jgi:hypothetical protein